MLSMLEVEFNLMLKDLSGKERTVIDIGEKICLRELTARLGLPEDVVGMLFINGQWAPLATVIRDGDKVRLYPDMEGG